MIVEALLAVFVILSAILGFLLRASLKREAALNATIVNYDKFYTDLQEGLSYVLTEIKTVDIRGAFEADDEVGLIFKAIKGMIESLRVFQSEGDGAATEEE